MEEVSLFISLTHFSSDYVQCSTRKIISSQCRTEKVEPGKFIKRCEKTEQLLKDCVGSVPKSLMRSWCLPVGDYLALVGFRDELRCEVWVAREVKGQEKSGQGCPTLI